jgi:thioredoxin reductase
MSDDHSDDSDNKSNGNMDAGDDDDQRDENKHKKVKRKKNQMELECRVLITCCHRDVDEDVFRSIHENGLVYNGRLIVDRNFQTTDPSIFAAGSLCEFSNRYKALA